MDAAEGENLFGETIAKVGPPILAGLDALEQAFRQLHPPAFPILQVRLAPVAAMLESADRALDDALTPVSLTAFRQDLREVLWRTRRALSAFVESGPPEARPKRTGLFRSGAVAGRGNLERLRGRPVYLVHGALDWMLPVALAREAARILAGSGAALVYRELENLSHTCPREQNAKIIEWFDPRRRPDALAGPTAAGAPR